MAQIKEKLIRRVHERTLWFGSCSKKQSIMAACMARMKDKLEILSRLQLEEDHGCTDVKDLRPPTLLDEFSKNFPGRFSRVRTIQLSLISVAKTVVLVQIIDGEENIEKLRAKSQSDGKKEKYLVAHLEDYLDGALGDKAEDSNDGRDDRHPSFD